MGELALRYNHGKPRWSLIHYKSLEPLIRVMEYGAHKYSTYLDKDLEEYKGSEITLEEVKELELIRYKNGKDNWKNPMDTTEILESLQRHLAAIMDGEDNDKESGLPHIGHLMANAMMYNYHKSNNEVK